MTNRHRNRRSKTTNILPARNTQEATPTTSTQPAHDDQQASKLIKPQSDFDRIMSEPDVLKNLLLQHEEQRGNKIARNVQSIMENDLECKVEPEWLLIKCLGNKLGVISPYGTLFLFDCRLRKVCWSIPIGKILHISYQSSENNRPYKLLRGNSRSVSKHTKESKQAVPQVIECHASEFVTKPDKYLKGHVFSSKSVGKVYVTVETGTVLYPSMVQEKLKEVTTDSSSDKILCITRTEHELTSYDPVTHIVLSYRRIATFNISIVGRGGARLHEKNEVPARQGQTLTKPRTIGKISLSDQVIGNCGKDTVLVKGEYQQPAVIVCIKKEQSVDGDVKKEVNIFDVCGASPNFVDVYGVESDQYFNYVATECCETSLREFIRSFHNPGNQHLKDSSKLLELMRGIVTRLACLHYNRISHGKLHLDSIFVDKYSRPKILVTSLFADATDDMLRHDMLDLGKVLFFCFIGVEYKNEKLNSPKPKSHLKPIYDCPDALDLLRKLLDENPATRATALQASNHTLFWSPSKNLRFIRVVTERLELKVPKLLTAINAINGTVFGGSWDTYLPTNFLDVMEDGSYGHEMKDGSYRKHVYVYNSTYDLLLIIRHLITHETRIRHQLRLKKGLQLEVQEMFGTAGFESYFRKKFPNLVNEVYNVMKKHLGDEANFLEYYKQSPL